MNPMEYKNIVQYKVSKEYPPKFSKTDKCLLRRKSHLYVIEDGVLYYVRHKGQPNSTRAKVLCGEEEAKNIFTDIHAISHCGQKKTREAISQRFYWPGMSQDIHQWVAQCPECQNNSVVVKQEVEYHPLKVTTPFELVDVIGKLKTTQSGNQYICVLVDYFTKWSQVYAIKSLNAEEVCQCLLKFVYQFEAPKRILTDQDPEFVNEINSNMCKMLGIKRRELCTPYYPQTNGLVERMNETIQRALAKLVHDMPDVWDQHLDAVMFGFRNQRQITTKFSPFHLMFGREARSPSEIPEDYMVDSSVEDNLSIEEVAEKTDCLVPYTEGKDRIPLKLSTGLHTTSLSHAPSAVPDSTGPPTIAAPTGHPVVSTGPQAAAASPSGPPAEASSDGRLTTAISDVKDAWRGERPYVLLARLGPYKIFYNDIFNTGPQMEFESEIINAYLMKLVERYNQNNTTRAFAVDTFEMTRIWEGKKPKIKIVPQLYELILGVVNQAHHWMLVVILPAKETSLFLDPLGEKEKAVNQCKDVTRSFMKERGLNPSRWACETRTHSIQQDATSCGAFALKFAECILDGLPLVFDTSPSSVNNVREAIAVYLLMNTDDLTNLCHICGDHTGDTLSIRCDMCQRSYHTICAKYPKKRKRSYMCEACQ